MKNKIILAAVVLSLLAPAAALAQSTSCVSIPSGLALGSTGQSVSDLQRFLVAQNYPGGGAWMITGYYGEATVAAVRNFQAAHGLPQSGSVDASTALIMSSGCSSAYAPAAYGAAYLPSAYSSYYANTTYPGFYPSSQTYPSYYPGYPGYPSNQQGYPYYSGLSPVITSLSQNTGFPGQSVTIFGQGFDPFTNTVVFNGTSLASIPSPSGNSLTFTVPSTYYQGVYSLSGTQVQLYVTNARGTSNSIGFTLFGGGYGCSGPSCYCAPGQGGTYPYGSSYYPYNYSVGNWYCPQPINNQTAPTISYLSPSSGGVGTSVTVYGSGFSTANNTVHFGVGIVTGLLSSDGQSVSFVVPASLSGFGTQPITLTTYPVSVTNSLGYTTNAVPFTVTSVGGSGGGPVISSVSGPTSLAVGQSGTWTVNVASGYGQYLTFSVDWGDSRMYPYAASSLQNVSQTNTLTHTYQVAGTYTIRFTVTNSYGQSNYYTTTITVGGGSAYGSTVSIFNMAFSPNSISVNRGATVVWTNNDSVPHTVTSSNGFFSSGVLYPAQTYQYAFANPGTYTYYDTYHPQMTGTVIVY